MTQPKKLSPLHTTAQALGARFASPAGWQLPAQFGDVEDELAAARDGVALADMSANGKVLVQGEAAGVVLRATWDLPELAVNGGAIVEADVAVYRLRHDLFFVHIPAGDETDVTAQLPQVTDAFITVTDVTHGRAELHVAGPRSAELLSRLCGLDFHHSRFPNLAAKQSSVAKTTQLVIRRDRGSVPAYALVGPRSLGVYLWKTIMEAGRDLNVRPVGLTALNALE